MKRVSRIFAAMLLSLVIAMPALAAGFFNGLIEDGAGKGIKGAKVWLTDKRHYTKSDKKGRFGLEEVNEGDTIHIEYQKTVYAIPVGNVNGMKIIIVGTKIDYKPDTELVSYGYGWVTSRDNTGTSNGISGARLVATGQSTIIQALEGLVPGLNVSPLGKVTIRGTNTFIGNDEPLYIVDGSIVGSLDFINIHSVDHVEVIKDATIYGSRGAGGAIVVYTKRGNGIQ